MDFTDYSENTEHFDESGFCRHCGKPKNVAGSAYKPKNVPT